MSRKLTMLTVLLAIFLAMLGLFGILAWKGEDAAQERGVFDR